MNIIRIVLGLIVLISCVRNKNENSNIVIQNVAVFNSDTIMFPNIKKLKTETDTLALSANVDKVEILCLFFGEYSNNSFRVFLSNSELSIVNTVNEKDITYIKYNEIRYRLIKKINELYIDKNSQIELSTESELLLVTDYPRSEERRVGKECRTRWTTN